MRGNAPDNYKCPICLGNRGVENEDTLLRQADLVFEDDLVKVWVNSFWVGVNYGHLIVVPAEHYETIYDLPIEVGYRVFEVSKQMSLAMKKVYKCDGVTLRQNNEPAGDQHAFHYHLHIFPRYESDNFNQELTEDKKLAPTEERRKYSQKLREYLKQA